MSETHLPFSFSVFAHDTWSHERRPVTAQRPERLAGLTRYSLTKAWQPGRHVKPYETFCGAEMPLRSHRHLHLHVLFLLLVPAAVHLGSHVERCQCHHELLLRATIAIIVVTATVHHPAEILLAVFA